MKKSCMHQSRGRISNKFDSFVLRILLWYLLHEQTRTLAQCEWINDGKAKTVGYGYIRYNMEWEEAHSLAERAMWKDILEGTKGKNCYGSTLVLTGITWQETGSRKQKSNIVRKKQKTALENGNNLGIKPDKTSWRETLHCPGAWNCSHSVTKQGRNKIWVLFSNCKTKQKKLTNMQTKPTRPQLD